MDREILFRGKRKDGGGWVQGFLYITKCGEYEISAYSEDLDIARYTHMVAPATVGQFTGLTDKNGNKIFEGDIYQYIDYSTQNDATCVCEVKYDRTDLYTQSGEIAVGFWLFEYGNGKVIGNTTDNPELLEETP